MDKMKNEKEFYLSNQDGSVKVTAISNFGMPGGDIEHFHEISRDMQEYKWRDEDFLLATYPRNGTHVTWEVMNMLVNGSAEHIKKSKLYCSIEFCPLSKCDEWFPSPRVLNTHYRLDVLPKEFHGRKTVLVLRNPKDVAVSYYNYMLTMTRLFTDGTEYVDDMVKMSLGEYIRHSFLTKDQALGNYFDYVEYMWSLRDDPNLLIIFYEDLVLETVKTVEKIDAFMGTNRSLELIRQIAEATSFEKMKDAKGGSMDELGQKVGIFRNAKKGAAADVYRKGKVGDWKNCFTVADNEFFESVLEKWPVYKDIPFKYQL